MNIQIEITTICNLKCFYCAGRDLPQKFMSRELFEGIIDSFPESRRVSLQGEGEPALHPDFWEMVRLLDTRGHKPYTIMNGTRLEPDLINRYFPSLGVSLDTLDAEEAREIGRGKLPDILNNLESLLALFDARKIIVHTVDYGQNKKELQEYIKRLGITKHVIQPLQTKSDYAYRYPSLVTGSSGPCTYSCGYINSKLMRFFNVDGVELPCCFIKDVGKFKSVEHIHEAFAARTIPSTCTGCREIYVEAPLAQGVQLAGSHVLD